MEQSPSDPERPGDSEYQLRALWGLTIYRVYIGNYRAALELARTYRTVANKKGDAADQLSCDRLTATALHYLGEQTDARRRLDHMLSRYVAPAHRSHIVRFQFDQRVAARSTLSHILWLQGFPDQAVRSAAATLEVAQATDHPLSLCNALGHGAFPVALYVGDLAAAEQFLSMLRKFLAEHALTVWNVLGLCLRGLLLVKRGDIAGPPLLRSALDELRDMRFHLRYAAYLGILADGLGAAGQMRKRVRQSRKRSSGRSAARNAGTCPSCCASKGSSSVGRISCNRQRGRGSLPASIRLGAPAGRIVVGAARRHEPGSAVGTARQD